MQYTENTSVPDAEPRSKSAGGNRRRIQFVPAEAISPQPGQFRQKLEPSSIKELADSIQAHGLMHPPTVTEADVDGRYMLVAGGRRLAAMKSLHEEGRRFEVAQNPVPRGMIPVMVWSGLSLQEAMELELEENIRRQDLTWQEQCQAVARLHELRQEEHDGNWSLSDTANEIRDMGGPTLNPSSVHDQVLLARKLDDPLVRKARSMREAMKELARSLERDFLAALGHQGPMASELDLHIGDCREVMRELPEASYDLVITDPPYGIDVDFRKISQKHIYDNRWRNVAQLLTDTMVGLNRVCRPEAHMYMFCTWEHYREVENIVIRAGWVPWKRPFVWNKEGVLLTSGSYGPIYSYELVLFARRGNKPFLQNGRDVVTVPFVKNKLHAAQKPTELYEEFMRRSAQAGDRVLDPFCGAGTVFAAAKARGLMATGIDLDERSREMVRQLLKGGTQQ